MVRLISRQRGGLAALKLTKLFGINDFPAAKDSGKVLIIIIYCYLIIITTENTESARAAQYTNELLKNFCKLAIANKRSNKKLSKIGFRHG